MSTSCDACIEASDMPSANKKPPVLFKQSQVSNAFGQKWNFETETEGCIVTFSTEFDSGNLADVEQDVDNLSHFKLWIRRDCLGTEFEKDLRSWFHFSIRCTKKNSKIKLTINNMNTQKGLFSCGYRPVMCIGNPTPDLNVGKWTRIPAQQEHGVHQKLKDGSQMARWMSWEFEFHELFCPVFFAFCYPYPLTSVLDHIKESYCRVLLYNENVHHQTTNANVDEITAGDSKKSSGVTSKSPVKRRKCKSNCKIYYHVNQIVSSIKGRPMHVVTVTSMRGISGPEDRESSLPHRTTLFPDGKSSMPRHFRSSDKPVCLVSSRVHPGETPASFIFEGFLNFLIDPNDPRAAILRDKYVFKLIPCLNPDGVVDGHYRSDSRGLNLNRCYLNPDPALHPTIFASRELCAYYASQGRLLFFLDLHAHANRKGMFCFGNQLPDIDKQVENELFPWLISTNSPHMDVLQCEFGIKNLKTKSKYDTNITDKKGAGRAAIHEQFGIIHSYTLESHYVTGALHKVTDTVNTQPTRKSLGAGSSKASSRKKSEKKLSTHRDTANSGDVLSPKHPASSVNRSTAAVYEPMDWRYLGKSVGIALVDMMDINPHSRIPSSAWKSLNGLKQRIRRRLELKDPYRKSLLGNNLKTLKSSKSSKNKQKVIRAKNIHLQTTGPPSFKDADSTNLANDTEGGIQNVTTLCAKPGTFETPTQVQHVLSNSPVAAGTGVRAAINLKAKNGGTSAN